MEGTDEIRQAATIAREHRAQTTDAIRAGGGTPAVRQLLHRLDRNYAKAAKALDLIAGDLDLLGRLSEGNDQ